MESYVLLVKELLNKCNLRECGISLRGSAAGSIVLYLMGISEVDPLKHGLEPEIIFGNEKDREIDIDINVAAERYEDLLQKLGTLTGVEAAVRAGTFTTITHAMAEVLLEDYTCDTGHYIPEDNRSICPLSVISDGTTTTYYEYYFIMEECFIKLDLIKQDPQEMLLRLAQQTGTDLAEVPMDDGEVLKLFTPEENGKVLVEKKQLGIKELIFYK